MPHTETVLDVGNSGWAFTMPDQVTLSQAGASALNLSGTTTPLTIDIRLNADLLFNADYHGIISINMRELAPGSPNTADPSSGLRGPIRIVLHNELGIPLLNPPAGDTMALYAAGVSDQFPTSPAPADSFHTIYTHFHGIQLSGATQTFPGFTVRQQVGAYPGAYPGNPSGAPNWLQLDGALAPGATLASQPFTFHRRDTAAADDTSLNLVFLSGAFDPAALAQVRSQWEDSNGVIRPEGTLAPGGTLRSTIEAPGDKDLFAVTLAAGQTYAFDLTGVDGGGGTLADPYLRLMNAAGAPVLLNGTPVQSDDYYPGTRDSHITFKPATSGAYYLDVRSYYSDATGTYTLSAPTVRQGGAGADLFTDAPGRQFYDGGAGRDTLVVPGATRRGATVTRAGPGEAVLAHDGQADTLLDLEEVRFIDGRLVFDAGDTAAQVARLYQAGLGRAPDQGGLNYWIAALQNGAPLADLATGFLSSPEFAGRFGTGLGNSAFVSAIYDNVLGRPPEAAGLAFWTAGLDRGGVTRGETLAGISESGENRSRTAVLAQNGIWDRSEAAQQVARLYDTVLARLPDAAGLGYWTSALEAGTDTLPGIARWFAAGPEFTAVYGALANRAFVERLYVNTLGRPGDSGGVDYWTNALGAGASRADVAVGFSESTEHQARTAANTGSETSETFGVKLM